MVFQFSGHMHEERRRYRRDTASARRLHRAAHSDLFEDVGPHEIQEVLQRILAPESEYSQREVLDNRRCDIHCSSACARRQAACHAQHCDSHALWLAVHSCEVPDVCLCTRSRSMSASASSGAEKRAKDAYSSGRGVRHTYQKIFQQISEDISTDIRRCSWWSHLYLDVCPIRVFQHPSAS